MIQPLLPHVRDENAPRVLTVGQLTFATPVTFQAADLDAYHVSMPTTGRMQAWHAGREVISYEAPAVPTAAESTEE